MKLRILIISIAALMLIGIIGCSDDSAKDQGVGMNEAATNMPLTAEATTDEASSDAAFSLPAVDVDGHRRNFSEWYGKKPFVVNFWGTWCPPCRREIPDLVKLYEEYYPKGVEIVSLAVRDTPEKVKQYTAGANMHWVMLMAEKHHAEAFGLSGSVPTTIFYDKNGRETARFVGSRDYGTFKKAFEEIANES